MVRSGQVKSTPTMKVMLYQFGNCFEAGFGILFNDLMVKLCEYS